MNRTPVKSSHLRSVGYDENTGILEVEFHDRRIYQYSNVPASVYLGLMSASSHGIYFDRHVIKAGYHGVQVF